MQCYYSYSTTIKTPFTFYFDLHISSLNTIRVKLKNAQIN